MVRYQNWVFYFVIIVVIYWNQVFDFLRIMVIVLKNCLDTQRRLGGVANNCRTLIHLSCHHLSIRPIIHLSCHGLYIPMGQRKSGIQMLRGEESNRKRWHTCQSPALMGQMDEMMLHIHLVIHLSRHGLFIPTGWRKSGTHTHTHTHTHWIEN